MKKFVTLTLALLSLSAFADYNSDAIRGDVLCKIAGGGGTVILKADRKTFIATLLQGRGVPPLKTTYVVSKRESDGGTMVQYFSKTADWGILTLSDSGDTFEMDGAYTNLICPK